MITEASIIVVTDDLMSADLGNEAVVLDAQSGKYYGLNEVGSRTLELANNPITVGEILDRLLQEYDVDHRLLEQDVLAFLQQLAAEQLIQVLNEVAA
jgi:hypothetical protein